jgi:hypothetical protein
VSRTIAAIAVALFAAGGLALGAASCGARPCGEGDALTSGVGVPCEETAECGVYDGLSCPGLADPSALPFCTRPCDYGDPDEDVCGDGARCTYVGSGGRCVPATCSDSVEVPLPISEDTTVGRINPEGVGQPCEGFLDCTGSAARLCEKDDGGFDFCTADCAWSLDSDPSCGDDAVCVYVGAGLGRCVPEADADRLAQEPPAVADVVIPCCAMAEGNEQGVGIPCESHSDCSLNPGAQNCPQVIEASLPNWCSHLCDFGDDEDCGEGAFCWWRESVEGGMVGSCAPIACLAENDPAPCAAR